MKLPENFVVIDCETSGLSPERHALLSIGAVTAAGAEFYVECLFDETKEFDPEAMAVNGFAGKPSGERDMFPEQAVGELLEWLRTRPGSRTGGRWIVGGKNPQFDFSFLVAAGAGGPVADVLCRRCIDLHTLAYWWALQHGIAIDGQGFSTELIYGHLGFQPEPRPHHALTGARLEMAIFRRLAGELGWFSSMGPTAPVVPVPEPGSPMPPPRLSGCI